MRTKRNGGHEIKVSLVGTDQQATVQVDAVDPQDDERTVKHVTRYLDALDRRMDSERALRVPSDSRANPGEETW